MALCAERSDGMEVKMKKARRRSTVVLRTITAVFILLMAMVITSCSSKSTTTMPATIATTTTVPTTTATTTPATTVSTTTMPATTATTMATATTTEITQETITQSELLAFDDSSLRMEYLKEAMTISNDLEEAFNQMNVDYEIVLQTRDDYEKWLTNVHAYVAVQTTNGGEWVVITAWQRESGKITYVDKNGEVYSGLAKEVLPEKINAIYPII